jgi:hypothetical protein
MNVLNFIPYPGRSYLWLITVFLLFHIGSFAQLTGDYRTVVSGNWTSIPTWETYNGSAWVPAISLPASTNDVTIKSGHTVIVNVSSQNCRSLTIESAAKLYANNTSTNFYINVWGSGLVCNGEIGNGATFDGISFNFEGTTTTISGTGIFTASRIRKEGNINLVTNLIIAKDITLRWNQASNTQLYNNSSAKFNITINAGVTVNCAGSASNPGNVAIDGTSGANALASSGTITVNGSLIVAGTIYLNTNNTSTNDSCSWIVNNGGFLKVAQISTGGSGTAIHRFRILTGGKLEISGSPGIGLAGFAAVSPASSNNIYWFSPGSYTEFTAAGNQYVPVVPGPPSSDGWGYLKVAGSGTKTLAASTTYGLTILKVFDDFEISNATGSPVFDCQGWTIQPYGDWINYNQSGFNETNGRVTFEGSGTSSITCPGGEVFYYLRYQKIVTPLIFNTKVDVRQTLDWFRNGSVNLNGHRLVLRSSSPLSLTGYSNVRYIYSERTDNASLVVWYVGTPGSLSTYTIPFGRNTSTYVPFQFSVPGGVTVDSMKVATYGTAPDNLPWPTVPNNVTNLTSQIWLMPDNRDATVDRFWQINSTAAVPPLLNFVFTYGATELPVSPYNVPTSMGAQRWNPLTGVWQLPVLGTGSASYTVTVNNTNGYGPWTLVNYSSPLPVTLVDFKAFREGDNVNVKWNTASELNNSGFDVERSADGRHFDRIGTVLGAGTTSVAQHYSFPDFSPLPGLSYYRLKQIDFDGQFTYSDLAAIRFGTGTDGFIYPQPASGVLYWETAADNTNPLNFNIFNSAGALVHQEQGGAFSRYSFDISDLSSSLYFLVVTEADGAIRQRLPVIIHNR